VILTKWTALGRDAGAAGVPVTEANSFSTFGANSGMMQGFAGGVIYGAAAGREPGRLSLRVVRFWRATTRWAGPQVISACR